MTAIIPLSISYDSTNLAGTVGGAAFELIDTFVFAITIIFTIINASCQRHSIDIEALVPVDILGKILKENYVMIGPGIY